MRKLQLFTLFVLASITLIALAQSSQYQVVCCGPKDHYFKSECYEGPDAQNQAWAEYYKHKDGEHDVREVYIREGRSDCQNTKCPRR